MTKNGLLVFAAIAVAGVLGGPAAPARAQASWPGGAYFVSPNGSDANDGLSRATPFASLDRAQKAMRSSAIKTTYLLGGLYSLAAPLGLGKADSGESWLAAPGETPVLDGGGTTPMALRIGAAGVTVRWLTFHDFAQDGVYIQGASNLVIDSNRFKTINSTGWNQAAIMIVGTIVNGRITHNLIEDTQYDGILSATSPTDNNSGLLIDGNLLKNTCISVNDCGAIHANDRSHKGAGVTISNNVIHQFGDGKNLTSAIYLDDLMSNTTVENNIISGSGQFGMEVHAGDHNLIRNNIFDLSEAVGLVRYTTAGYVDPNDDMAGNVFTCNVVYSAAKAPAMLWLKQGPHVTPPLIHDNLYSPAARQARDLPEMADAHPVVADPGFADPSSGDYTLMSQGAPTFCDFHPIDARYAGPLPNLGGRADLHRRNHRRQWPGA
jgi:parallel beta-helix repeat protein